jgi:hypothetical protein
LEKKRLEQNKTIGMKGNWKVFKLHGSKKMGQRWIKMASQGEKKEAMNQGLGSTPKQGSLR